MKKSEFFRKAADCIEMCESAGIAPTAKYDGATQHCEFSARFYDRYEFPLAIVEGKPVFAGDKLYGDKGGIFTAHECLTIHGGSEKLSWNPPKPKTVTIELPYLEAIELRNHLGKLMCGTLMDSYTTVKTALEQTNAK